MNPGQRQTQSYLRRILGERRIQPKSKLGQNFLIDLNLLDLILRTAELTREDLALEIGSGTGSLTVKLVEQAGAVVSVEIDENLARMTEDALPVKERVALLHIDVLKNKNELSADIFRAVHDLTQRYQT